MPEVVNIDRFGKMFIPKRVRERLAATRFELEMEDENLILRPVRDPLEFFGALKGLDPSEVDRMREEDDRDGHTA
jgi:bifunctional DNA-binding transcriptional regulator/antitoxin component of YhaV-PrlF toxin-antitoxin module